MLYVKDLNYQFDESFLIKSLSHQFMRGKLYGLIGLNGSGKTTFLKLLSGIIPQTSGSILWNNVNLDELSRIKRSQLISLATQTLPINFDYSVEDIVSMGTYANRHLIKGKLILETVLEKTHVSHLRKRMITQISNGEKQRVFLARALATQCSILLFDEPTACLDIKHQKIIWEIIHSLKNENKIVIVATHDLIQAKNYCDEFLLIDSSECVATGNFESIKAQPNSKCFFQFANKF